MSALFDKGREGYLGGALSWNNDDVRVMLVKDTYTFDAADEFVADLGAVDNGRSIALAGKSKTNGVADAADASLLATDAEPCDALIVFKHTGNDATARLIAYVDNADGLPFTPAAGQLVDIRFDNGPNKIFKL